ncbi:MAG: extracellular solute-binding protein [Lachnospiraceae bacterium]|nr:extracellular solute-binding protein [Lachnospiraceae bacterium]
MVIGSCACSGKEEIKFEPDANTEYITLALREGIYCDVIKECLPKFMVDNNVYCEVVELSEDGLHSEVYEDAPNASGKYDLCMVDGSWMAEYTARNVLSELSELGYTLDDDIIPATTTVCYQKDKLYLTPYGGNVTVLLYNKLMMKGAGYEPGDIDSLEDVMNICKEAKKNRNYGFMYRGDTENNLVVDFLPFLLSFGGWVVDDSYRPTVDTPEFKRAMEFYLELIETGKAEERDELVVAIANQAAAMAIGWPGWYTPDKRSSADYCALSGKVDKNSKSYNANVYGIWTLGIPANSTHKEAAIKLLKYLMDKDVQKSTIESGGVPCRYSCLKDEEVLKKFPQYEAVCKALESGVYRPIMEEWTDFYTILGKEMKLIIDGEKSIDEGLSDAQNKLEEMLILKK